jgi:transposase InsO family protein
MGGIVGQVLHGSARTTAAVRRAIQDSQASLNHLAGQYGINPKTVAKWRKRASVDDARMGPQPRSTVLTEEQEAVAVAFRKQTLLPLDDCLYTLQATIPCLTRSALHRCFQRHGVSRLPEIEGDKRVKKKFKKYPIGYFHIDIAEVRTEQGKLYLFVAIDRTSKFSYAQLHERATRRIAGDFLRALIAAVPYTIHTVLTDNGTHFVDNTPEPTLTQEEIEAVPPLFFRVHAFAYACEQNSIEHRRTKPKHPWTNGQVERMNRTLKEATVKRFYYETHSQLKEHLQIFLMAYNFAKRLKTLKGLTPYQFICQQWQKTPLRFNVNPLHHTVGLNS